MKSRLIRFGSTDHSLEMSPSILSTFILLVLVLGDLGQSFPNCPESRCGSGPTIRFPFRLKDRQPDYCGYHGFDLSCTERNDTLLELPNSVKLYVQEIDYLHQVLNVSDPDHCFLRQASNIKFSSSPFRFYGDFLYNYTLFNCTSAERNILGIAPCLEVPGYEVYAITSSSRISEYTLTSCTKMYNIFSIPPHLFIQNLSRKVECLDSIDMDQTSLWIV